MAEVQADTMTQGSGIHAIHPSPTHLPQMSSQDSCGNILPDIRATSSSSKPRRLTSPPAHQNHPASRPRNRSVASLSIADYESNYDFQTPNSSEQIGQQPEQNLSIRPRYSNWEGVDSHFQNASKHHSQLDSNTASSPESNQLVATPSSSQSPETLEDTAISKTGQPAVRSIDPNCSVVNPPLEILEPSKEVNVEPMVEFATPLEMYTEYEYDEDEECDLQDEISISNIEEFESKVLQVVGYDSALAASLIPQLHAMLFDQRSPAVISWEATTTRCVANSDEQAPGSSAGQSFAGGPSSNGAQKRDRGSDDGFGDKDGNSDDRKDERESKRAKGSQSETKTLFACPFHKKEPSKYNSYYNYDNDGKAVYRTCQGPGFLDIRRLKEHLKRSHTRVQCERCSWVFTGSQKERIKELTAHRLKGCPDCPPRINEGITDVQWNDIENPPKINGSNGSYEKPKTNVGKWNEIWFILFPNDPLPDPWCHPPTPSIPSESSFSNHMKEFGKLFDSTFHAKEDLAYCGEQFQTSAREVSMTAFQLWYAKLLVEQKEQPSAVQKPEMQNPHVSNVRPMQRPFQEGLTPSISIQSAPRSRLPASRTVSSPEVRRPPETPVFQQPRFASRREFSRRRSVSVPTPIQNYGSSVAYSPVVFPMANLDPRNTLNGYQQLPEQSFNMQYVYSSQPDGQPNLHGYPAIDYRSTTIFVDNTEFLSPQNPSISPGNFSSEALAENIGLSDQSYLWQLQYQGAIPETTMVPQQAQPQQQVQAGGLPFTGTGVNGNLPQDSTEASQELDLYSAE